MGLNIRDITLSPRGTNAITWANNFNTSFVAIDSHNHTQGQGVQLSFDVVTFIQNFSCATIQQLQLANFVTTGTQGNCSVSSDGIDLYVVDGYGREVRLTNGGNPNYVYIGGLGFSGDYVSSSAKATYTSSNKTYTFTGAGGTQGAEILCNKLGNISNTFTLPFSVYIPQMTLGIQSPTLSFSTTVPSNHIISGDTNHQPFDLGPYVNLTFSARAENQMFLFYNVTPSPLPYYGIFASLSSQSLNPLKAKYWLQDVGDRAGVDATVIYTSNQTLQPYGGVSQACPLVVLNPGNNYTFKYSDNVSLLQEVDTEQPFWNRDAVIAFRTNLFGAP